MSKLDHEEQEFLEAFESEKTKHSKDGARTQKRHQEYAKARVSKDPRINLRLPGRAAHLI